jgi:hypothetical protein
VRGHKLPQSRPGADTCATVSRPLGCGYQPAFRQEACWYPVDTTGQKNAKSHDKNDERRPRLGASCAGADHRPVSDGGSWLAAADGLRLSRCRIRNTTIVKLIFAFAWLCQLLGMRNVFACSISPTDIEPLHFPKSLVIARQRTQLDGGVQVLEYVGPRQCQSVAGQPFSSRSPYARKCVTPFLQSFYPRFLQRRPSSQTMDDQN